MSWWFRRQPGRAAGAPSVWLQRVLEEKAVTDIATQVRDGGPGVAESPAPWTSTGRYERAPVLKSFTPFESSVAQLLSATPDMPATVLAERIGGTGSITWFRDNVPQLRPDHRPVDPSHRLAWLPGDVAQCDLWFPPMRIRLEDGSRALLPVL